MDQAMDQASNVWPLAGLAAVMAVGLVLWLLGGRLARLACVISGLVLGAMGGWTVGGLLAEQGAMLIPLVIGGGIAGGLLAGLLFRLWMALSGAVLLALVVPAAVLVWQGAPPIPARTQQPGAAGPSRPSRAPSDRITPSRPPSATDPAEPASPEKLDLNQQSDQLMEAARGWYEQQRQRVRAWWDQLEDGRRWLLYAVAAVGALLGLVLGLAVPNTAAALETALTGAILLLVPGRELLQRLAPEAARWTPSSPRLMLITLGLITVVGGVIQWTFRKRRTE